MADAFEGDPYAPAMTLRPDVTVEPLQDRVLVQRLGVEEITIGHIIVPETAQDPPQEARVLAVGEGRITDDGRVVPLRVHVDDIVLIGRYAGTAIKLGHKDYTIVREDDLLAIVRGAT